MSWLTWSGWKTHKKSLRASSFATTVRQWKSYWTKASMKNPNSKNFSRSDNSLKLPKPICRQLQSSVLCATNISRQLGNVSSAKRYLARLAIGLIIIVKETIGAVAFSCFWTTQSTCLCIKTDKLKKTVFTEMNFPKDGQETSSLKGGNAVRTKSQISLTPFCTPWASTEIKIQIMTQMMVEEITLEDLETTSVDSEGSGTLLQLDLAIQSHIGLKTKITSSFQLLDRNLSIS